MTKYNIEITLECRTPEDATEVAGFCFFSGFMPFTDGTIVTIIAKNVDSAALEYITSAIEEDERVVSSSFHQTPF